MDVAFILFIVAGCLIFPVGCAFLVIEDNVRAFAYSGIVIIFITMAALMSSYPTLRSNGLTNTDGSYSGSAKAGASTSTSLRKEWSAAVGRGKTKLGYDAWRTNLNTQWSQDVANNKTTLGYEDWVRRRNQ